MVTIRNERPTDIAAREALLDRSFGGARFAKASERLREGRLPADRLSLVAAARGRPPGASGPPPPPRPPGRRRKGRLPADGLSLVAAERGRLVGTVRLW